MNTRPPVATLPQIAAAYIRATNNHDAAAFIACFSDSAIVNDAGRELRGIAAIKDWSDREIFDAIVTFDVLDVADRNRETVVRTKVDGNYDKSGLPDPLLLDHHLVIESDKIAGLTIRLAHDKSGT